MYQDVNGNMKLLWKEGSNVKGGKVESCRRIKDGNGRSIQGQDKVRWIWKENFEVLPFHNTSTEDERQQRSLGGLRLTGLDNGCYHKMRKDGSRKGRERTQEEQSETCMQEK